MLFPVVIEDENELKELLSFRMLLSDIDWVSQRRIFLHKKVFDAYENYINTYFETGFVEIANKYKN